LVGEDSNGNKYYENTGYQSGRHRWVEYADLDNYNTTSVPREWHGWLHHVDDEPGLTTRPVAPNEVTFLPAVSARSKDANEVTAAQHFPKGHFLNKRGIRNWKRYTPWSPP
jgi:NADH dehydrogenase (ubiquinone) 1 alpha subcomplex subunit 12